EVNVRKLPDPLKAQSLQPPTSTSSALSERRARVAKMARVLLGSYRRASADDPEVYVGATIRVLWAHPDDVIERVVDPLTGIPSRNEWPPNPKELKDACEEIYGPMRRAQEWDRRAIQQVQEAAARAGLPVPSVSEVQDTLAKQGISVT